MRRQSSGPYPGLSPVGKGHQPHSGPLGQDAFARNAIAASYGISVLHSPVLNVKECDRRLRQDGQQPTMATTLLLATKKKHAAPGELCLSFVILRTCCPAGAEEKSRPVMNEEVFFLCSTIKIELWAVCVNAKPLREEDRLPDPFPPTRAKMGGRSLNET